MIWCQPEWVFRLFVTGILYIRVYVSNNVFIFMKYLLKDQKKEIVVSPFLWKYMISGDGGCLDHHHVFDK